MLHRTIYAGSFAIVGVLLGVLVQPFSHTQAAQAGCRTFPETGKTVCGIFLSYWDKNGGLAQQGFPISGEIAEVSDTDGKSYTVQYFERAVFEYHPETPNTPVLLSLLGNFLYKQKYPSGAPGQVPDLSPNAMFFKETGKNLGGRFLEYWQQNGGLAQQGFPISDPFPEKNDLDGKTYTVQYFERAVFEVHPENKPPYDVLLSQLGTFRYRAKYGDTTPPRATTPVPVQPPVTGATAVPSGAYVATASVSNPNPTQRSRVRVTGKLTRGGQPVAGAVMNTLWHYKSKNTPCDGAKTDSNGVAGCTNEIGTATIGYTVKIDVVFLVDGREVARTETSFTPR